MRGGFEWCIGSVVALPVLYMAARGDAYQFHVDDRSSDNLPAAFDRVLFLRCTTAGCTPTRHASPHEAILFTNIRFTRKKARVETYGTARQQVPPLSYLMAMERAQPGKGGRIMSMGETVDVAPQDRRKLM